LHYCHVIIQHNLILSLFLDRYESLHRIRGVAFGNGRYLVCNTPWAVVLPRYK